MKCLVHKLLAVLVVGALCMPATAPAHSPRAQPKQEGGRQAVPRIEGAPPRGTVRSAAVAPQKMRPSIVGAGHKQSGPRMHASPSHPPHRAPTSQKSSSSPQPSVRSVPSPQRQATVGRAAPARREPAGIRPSPARGVRPVPQRQEIRTPTGGEVRQPRQPNEVRPPVHNQARPVRESAPALVPRFKAEARQSIRSVPQRQQRESMERGHRNGEGHDRLVGGVHRHSKPPAVNDHRFGRWHHWGRFHHNQHFVRTTVVFWAGGWPLSYYYPYSGRYYCVEPSTAYYATPPVPTGEQINCSYYELGVQWGQALMGETETVQEFVAYLRDYIVGVPAVAFSDFRRGFEAGYGANSRVVFDQAMAEAAQR